MVGSRTIEVTAADLVHYAGASGDRNPIHWNERFAREVGLPGVIAHGMFTMGAAVNVVVDWLGDPGRVVDYGVRFTRPVEVPDPGSRDRDRDGDGRCGGRRGGHRAGRPRGRGGRRQGPGPGAGGRPSVADHLEPAGDQPFSAPPGRAGPWWCRPQLDRKLDVRRLLAGQDRGHGLGDRLALGGERLRHRGEHVRGEPRQVEPVEAGDREVLRHAQPELARRDQHPGRQQVGLGEHGRRRVGARRAGPGPPRCPASTSEAEASTTATGTSPASPRPSSRCSAGGQSISASRSGPTGAQRRAPPSGRVTTPIRSWPRPAQVVDEHGGALPVGDPDHRDAEPGRALAQHHRDATAVQRAEDRGASARAEQQDRRVHRRGRHQRVVGVALLAASRGPAARRARAGRACRPGRRAPAPRPGRGTCGAAGPRSRRRRCRTARSAATGRARWAPCSRGRRPPRARAPWSPRRWGRRRRRPARRWTPRRLRPRRRPRAWSGRSCHLPGARVRVDERPAYRRDFGGILESIRPTAFDETRPTYPL